jgi:hypothetical protein
MRTALACGVLRPSLAKVEDRMMKLLTISGALVFATVALENEARACGGCFSRPETPTVVTDHRMILSVSTTASTLYDQIKYTGAPSSFAWVLPISGTVTVGISSNYVFSLLDQQTQTQIVPPPRNCPPAPTNCASGLNASAAPSAGDSAGGGVTVISTEVVGPYETVQLAATNPTALREWLTTNGFNIPSDVAPVIDEYVAEKFNFLALKLVPGKGIQDMRPVRVTSQGASVALPLRMVAAGTGAVVGVTLWILGEGRYQPQNFGSFIIQTSDIAWDWTQNKSNYTDLRAAQTAQGNGRVWEIESSIQLDQQGFQQTLESRGGPTATDYLPEKDAQGTVTKLASAVRDDDLATLFQGINGADSRVTRIRADLAHAALDTDLVVAAAPDQSIASNVRQITKELNQPLCTVYSGCESDGQAPRDEAAARSSGSGGGGTFTCDAASRPGRSWAFEIFGLVALVDLIRRRSRSPKR